MANNEHKITFKIIAGYIIFIALAIFAVWFIYGQIKTLSSSVSSGIENNNKLFLVNEVATNLFTAEGISKNIIQNQSVEHLPKYEEQIQTIQTLVDSLKVVYRDTEIVKSLEGINELLNQKTENLAQLLELRKQATTKSYYTKVIHQLQKTDQTFEDEDYEEQLKNHNPSVRRAIIGLIEFSKENRAEELTQKTSDSLINSLKNVLNVLEMEERKTMLTINQKENELLENDRIISNQLQTLRADIEMDEIKNSVNQVTGTHALLESTSATIGIIAIISVLTMILFLLLILNDINNSQKYRNELEQSKNFSDALLKSREQIMNTVTHDLRSPLNTVIGYSDLLNKTALTEKQKHYLSNLKTSSDYILRLVNDLLDLSKLEAGKMTIEKIRFGLANVIHSSVKNVIPEYDNKNTEIIIKIEPELGNDIISDPFRLQQILTNLISNAYKFTEQGTITIHASFIKNKSDSAHLKIAISDTGIGIPKEKLDLVFEEFSQVSNPLENKEKGFGLGLAITKKLVKLLDGSISVESTPQQGTTFSFSIPVQKTESSIKESHFQPARSVVVQASNKTVLIVDDDPSQLALTSEIVKLSGANFDSCTQASEALEKIQERNYDLILTDIQMPGMDGFDFLKKLKSHPKHQKIPIIALSGRLEILQDEHLEKGFSDSLLKPYKSEDLLRMLQKHLHTKPVKKLGKARPSKTLKYNLADILSFTEGDKTSLDLILNTFIGATKENLDQIKTAINSKNYSDIAFIAHKMSPMFRQLYISKAVEILDNLEHERIPEHELEQAYEFLEKIAEESLAAIQDEITG